MSGRIRTIKPEVLEDEVATGLSDRAWRLWVSSWVLADDHGNLRAHDKYLAANVWQDTSVDVAEARDELIRTHRWLPFAVRGQRYVHIRSWEKHQRIDNAGKPRVPSPSEDDGTWNHGVANILAENLGDVRRVTETVGGSPLRARAPSPTPITDHERDHESEGMQGDASDAHASSPPPAPSEIIVRESKPQRKPAKGTRGTRLPADWRPSKAVFAWARKELVADPLAPLEEFRDFWTSATRNATKLDWDAVYRNRLRELLERGRLAIDESLADERPAEDLEPLVPAPPHIAEALRRAFAPRDIPPAPASPEEAGELAAKLTAGLDAIITAQTPKFLRDDDGKEDTDAAE